MGELNKRIKSLFYLRLSVLICVPLQNLGITQIEIIFKIHLDSDREIQRC